MHLPVTVIERRRDVELRVVFDEVYGRVEAFFDTSSTWGGSALTMLVYRVVRESYPHLDALQVQTLVVASQRVYHARHGQGLRPAPVAPREPEAV